MTWKQCCRGWLTCTRRRRAIGWVCLPPYLYFVGIQRVGVLSKTNIGWLPYNHEHTSQVDIISDTNVLATKIITLKEVFPNANVLKVLTDQPKLLLSTAQNLKADAEKVRSCVSVIGVWRLVRADTATLWRGACLSSI